MKTTVSAPTAKDIPPVKPGNVIALVSDKGGVGKTVTAIHLASGLARLSQAFNLGWRVLLVDIDPQSSSVNTVQNQESLLRPFDENHCLGALLCDEKRSLRIHDFIDPSPWVPSQLFYVPSDKVSLERALVYLQNSPASDMTLRRVLRPVLQDYHFIVIDTGGSTSSKLVSNALAAATHVIVPLNSDFLGLESVPRANQVIGVVRDNLELQTPVILGYLLTLYRANVGTSRDTERMLRDSFGDLVFRTVIPLTGALSDALSTRRDIFVHDPSSAGSVAYRSLILEVLSRVSQK